MVDERIQNYIGIPFKEKGRTIEEGLDCWGLAVIVLEKVYNRKLPSYSSLYTWNLEDIAVLIDSMKPLLGLPEVAEPELGDLVLLHYMGRSTHTGIFVGDGLLLHSDPLGRGLSKLNRLSDPRISTRIEGFYSTKVLPLVKQ
jgi:cell wall-associated NlpC family hydrolase